MLKPIVMATICSVAPVPAFAQECLPSTDASRRKEAVDFARRLNAEQHLMFPQGRRYRPLDELRDLPPVPAGFHLQFHTDGRTYSFSLKDLRDRCRFAIFSDQNSDVYAAVPQPPGGIVLPLGTR